MIVFHALAHHELDLEALAECVHQRVLSPEPSTSLPPLAISRVRGRFLATSCRGDARSARP